MIAADNKFNNINECFTECPENKVPNNQNVCMDCHQNCLEG